MQASLEVKWQQPGLGRHLMHGYHVLSLVAMQDVLCNTSGGRRIEIGQP